MSLSRSAPLYLFFEVPAFQKHHEEELLHGGGFELAVTVGAKDVDVDEDRSDVSAFADEMLHGGVLSQLKLPPRLQRIASTCSSLAATSPTVQLGRKPSWSSFTGSGRRHRGFDPFATALEKVRRDGASPAPRRARSLSPLRGGGGGAAAVGSNSSRPAGAASAALPRKRRGVKNFLCSAVVVSARAAPRPLRGRNDMVCLVRFGL